MIEVVEKTEKLVITKNQRCSCNVIADSTKIGLTYFISFPEAVNGFAGFFCKSDITSLISSGYKVLLTKTFNSREVAFWKGSVVIKESG
jgi:hypothetical protein